MGDVVRDFVWSFWRLLAAMLVMHKLDSLGPLRWTGVANSGSTDMCDLRGDDLLSALTCRVGLTVGTGEGRQLMTS